MKIAESDVIRAINETLTYKFPDVKILYGDYDAERRPFFVLEETSTKYEILAPNLESVTINFSLFYFGPTSHKNIGALYDMKTAIRENFLKYRIETESIEKAPRIISFKADISNQELDKAEKVVINEFSINFENFIEDEVIDNRVSRYEDARANTNDEMMNTLDINVNKIAEETK